jgi:hypothetical protein
MYLIHILLLGSLCLRSGILHINIEMVVYLQNSSSFGQCSKFQISEGLGATDN